MHVFMIREKQHLGLEYTCNLILVMKNDLGKSY